MMARGGFYRTVLTVVNSYVCFYSSEFLCTTDAELSYFVREDIPFIFLSVQEGIFLTLV